MGKKGGKTSGSIYCWPHNEHHHLVHALKLLSYCLSKMVIATEITSLLAIIKKAKKTFAD